MLGAIHTHTYIYAYIYIYMHIYKAGPSHEAFIILGRLGPLHHPELCQLHLPRKGQPGTVWAGKRSLQVGLVGPWLCKGLLQGKLEAERACPHQPPVRAAQLAPVTRCRGGCPACP